MIRTVRMGFTPFNGQPPAGAAPRTPVSLMPPRANIPQLSPAAPAPTAPAPAAPAAPANPCPPGMVQNGDSCIDPTQWYGICPPNYQAVAPGGGVLTAAQQAAGQFSCVPLQNPAPVAIQPTAPAITTPAALPTMPIGTNNTLTTPTPVAAMPANYTADETTGNFDYTADIETVTNQLAIYGDTWDNPQAIVNQLYAAGIAPGSVTDAMALQYMTNVSAATTATAATAVLSDPTTWPWYYWAGAAALGLALFSGGSSKKH